MTPEQIRIDVLNKIVLSEDCELMLTDCKQKVYRISNDPENGVIAEILERDWYVDKFVCEVKDILTTDKLYIVATRPIAITEAIKIINSR